MSISLISNQALMAHQRLTQISQSFAGIKLCNIQYILHFVQFFVWFSILKLLQVEDMYIMYITGVWELQTHFLWIIIIETNENMDLAH